MHSVAEDGWSELAPAAAATTVASARIDPRGRRSGRVRLAGLAVALLALVGMCLLSVWVGANHLPFTVVWRVLWHNDGSPPALVVHDLRIPRTLLGLAVSA
ncbi:hypothetical protein [Candidatus Frankia alpina]|uniref:hypothetical protein n=1 Tax=Candidatus Frankia alpina TaxID=2699483 RepID=UPI001F1FF310|nr:hypothetical protein [Candidatus Frankia alpina]